GKLQANVASASGSFLVLTSTTVGPNSRIEFEEVDHDASLAVMGIPPRTYVGTDARAAAFHSSLDLSAGIDLSHNRYLRLIVDSKTAAEVDCANPEDPSLTLLNHVVAQINAAFGKPIASHDNHFLTIHSQEPGSSSSLMIQPAAAQDASRALLRIPSTFALGDTANPAKLA